MFFLTLYSNDNQHWEIHENRSQVARKAFALVQPKTVNARYVKIEFVRGKGNPATLAELEVFAKP